MEERGQERKGLGAEGLRPLRGVGKKMKMPRGLRGVGTPAKRGKEEI